MADDEGAATTNQSLVSRDSNPTTQIVTLQSDTSSFSAGIKLDENNYSLWHQIIEMKIAGREKHGHLTGDVIQPADSDPTFNKWRASDCQVKSWLFDTMQPNQIKRFIRYDTAKQVWAAIKQTYSDGADEAKIYDLHRRSFIMKQAGAPVAKYYGELTEIFQELDQLSPSTMEHPKDIETRRKEVDRLRVYIFLAGLDNNFDQIRGEILRMEPKPELEAAYAYIKRESNRQGTMSEAGGISETTALVAAKFKHSRSNTYSGDSTRHRAPMKCTKCGLDNHTIKGCYEIIGYPEGWVHKGRKKDSTRASFASTQSLEEPTSEPPSGTSGPTALTTSGTSSTSSRTCHRSWIIDTGATDHMTSSFNGLHSTKPSSQTHITSANGTTSKVMGEGSLSLTPSLSLDHVLVVPSLDYDLLSVPQIIDSLNCTVCFWPLYCLFQDLLTRTVIGCGTRRGRLYYLDLTDDSRKRLSHTHHVRGDESSRMKTIWLWHRRLGHASFGYLKLLFPDLFFQFVESDFHCETCILAKSHRVSYPLRLNKSSLPFMLVHSDVWGPSRVPTISGFKWFVTFIDDCTRMTWVFPLKQKSEVTAKFKFFHQYVATQFNKQITTLRSDNGGEYVNHDLHDFVRLHGMVHQTTCAYTPQQNGVAERKNRHLLEVVRASLFDAHMPHHFWGEALCSAAYLINRTPSSTLQYQTPFQTLTTLLNVPSTPNLEPRIFGCVAYVHVYPHQRGKLDPCALRCVFVGYADTQKGYKCFHPPTQTMHVTADVSFHEREFYYSGGVSEHHLQGENSIFAADTQIIQLYQKVAQPVSEQPTEQPTTDQPTEQPTTTDQPTTVMQQDQEVLIDSPTNGPDIFPFPIVPSPLIQSGPEDSPQVTEHLNLPLSTVPESSHTENTGYQLPHRTTRGIPRQQYDPDPTTKVKYPIANHVSLHRLSLSCASFVCQLSTVSIPSNVHEALKDPKWTQAMNDEMEALQKNSTWEMTILPKGKRTVGCRWIYTVKFKADGTIERYKARLVAKGYTQTYGIDYGETFAPVAKMNTIRVLLSLAANLNWPLHQFDVKNAFLHGDLEEEVYMDSPPGCKMGSNTGNMVCKLRKSLYGLKQSPRAWFGKFSKSMKDFGYKQSNSDHTLFLKHKKGKVTALIVYVDDMVVTGNDPRETAALQHHLASKFEMKDLGPLKYFLGIEVARSKQGIFLSQRKYILDLLTDTGMLASKPADTPMELNHQLGEYPDQVSVNKERYQRLVGKLIYLGHTRPDIAYAVSIVSQFMHAPSKAHMDAVYRILRYLKSSPGRGLMFTRHGHQDVEGHTDADWAGSMTDRRSTSGYFAFVGGNLVSWRSKKQKVVSRSSAEAEYRGMAHGVCELLWIRNLLRELGFKPKRAMQLNCDNKAAIDIAHNPVQHDRTKHVEVDRHFIKEKLEAKIIEISFVKSEDQLADVLTKAVTGRVFHSSLSKLGIDDIYAPT